jgi:CelD/BcsL family acetyltransferase involved in cellulose biosynthesis
MTPISAASHRIEIVTSLDAVREDWNELANENRNIFSTWEWASTWWRHFGERQTPLVIVCREPERGVTALLPLYLWSRRPLRIARFIGHGPADQLGPVSAAADRAVAAAALRDAAMESEFDVVLAELLHGGEGWQELLGEKPLRAEPSPILQLDRSWESYLDARSSNFRQQVRRRERNLERQHAVRFRLAVDSDRLQEDMTLLFALHRARWGSRSAFMRWEPFHRDFAAVALERGWLRLWILELDDRPAAAWYGFRFAGVESYYQAGRDPAAGDEPVGFVLLAHSIREAAADGMREYRLLRGAESFKLRFAEADPGVETFALVRGFRGKAARVVARVGLRSARARSALRRLARGSAS